MRSISTINTQLPPCAMCTIDDLIVIGTYKLQDEVRTGSLDVYDPDLNLKNSVPVKSAILDVVEYKNKVYCAHSTGIVTVWEIKDALPVQVHEIPIGESSDLVLQLDFNQDKMACTSTDGSLYLYDLYENKLSWSAQSHSLEPWCVRFGDGGIWTGADDQTLQFHSLDGTQLMKVKHHDAGVTSILPFENAVWTGGYDDNLRIMDLRTRRSIDSVNLGGGVWRLLSNPKAPNTILSCNMYNGLATLEKKDDLQLPEVTFTQTDLHESMVYGGTWLEDNAYVCSFYDCKVQRLKL